MVASNIRLARQIEEHFVGSTKRPSLNQLYNVANIGRHSMRDKLRHLIHDIPFMIPSSMLPSPAEEMSTDKKPYPLWDGKESIEGYAKRVNLDPAIALDLGDGVKMEFVLIPAGKFKMGSPGDETNRTDDEVPQHDVTISKPFYMGKFEVTQEQYKILMKRNHSPNIGARNPNDSVSWNNAQSFCKQMSQKTGRAIRLPSEAEWEYACRAGSTTPRHPPREREKDPPLTAEQRRRAAELIPILSSNDHTVREKATRDLIALGSGVLPLLDKTKSADPELWARMAAVKAAFQPPQDVDDLESVAWFNANSDLDTHPVGEKEPNAFNLYDMLGNVWEWVEDDWHDDYVGAPADGSAWIDTPRGDYRVARGGHWFSSPRCCQSDFRSRCGPDIFCGFRVVLVP
jgi:formylglycine-generating enzyme required for sulfatase activity